MKQKLTMILMMLGLSIGIVLFSAQNISAQDTDGDGVPDFRDNCPTVPNPEKIAFTSTRDGNLEIYVMNPDGSNVNRLTNNPAADLEPSFSANSNKIAFLSFREGNAEIYVMNPDGLNVTRLTNTVADDGEPAFSPDGSQIAFSSLRDGNQEIYVMNADGTNQTRLTNNAAFDSEPSWGEQADDNTPPVIDPIANIVVNLPANSTATSMAVTFPLPTASDNCDASVTVITNPVSGSQFNVGTTTVNVTATDSFGNQSVSSFTVTVLYRFSLFTFSDFLLPQNAPNEVIAGSNVPVSFSLSGYKGQNIYSSPPASQRINCINGSPITAFQTINRTLPDPFYNANFDIYTTTWKTQASWAGTCRRLRLSLNDGTTKFLDFRFN